MVAGTGADAGVCAAGVALLGSTDTGADTDTGMGVDREAEAAAIACASIGVGIGAVPVRVFSASHRPLSW